MKKQKVLALLMATAVTFGSAIPMATFALKEDQYSDVQKEDSFFEYVEDVVNYKIMAGLEDKENEFGVAEKITRADLVKYLYKMVLEPAANGSLRFEDVLDTEYEEAVVWADSVGLFEGLEDKFFENDTFAGDTEVTREQAAVILHNLAVKVLKIDFESEDEADAIKDKNGNVLKALENLDAYTDGEFVDEKYVDAVCWAVGYTLLNPATTDTEDERYDEALAGNLNMQLTIEKVDLAEAISKLLGMVPEDSEVTTAKVEFEKAESSNGSHVTVKPGKPNKVNTPSKGNSGGTASHKHNWQKNSWDEEGHYESILVSPEESHVEELVLTPGRGHAEQVHHEEEGHYETVMVSPEEGHYEKVEVSAEEGHYETIHHEEEGHYENVLVSPEEGHYETVHHEEEGHYESVLVSPEEGHYETVHHEEEGHYENVLVSPEEGHYETVHHEEEGHWENVLVSPEEGHWVHHEAEYETVHHEAEYETVHHEEEGHYETQQVQVGTEPIYEQHKVLHCNTCGEDFWCAQCDGGDGNAAAFEHELSHDTSISWGSKFVQHKVGEKPVYEEKQVWVVDKEAWDEQVLVKEAWDEQVLVKDAWDEWVVDKEAVYEDKWVVDKEAWDEEIWVVDKEAVYENKWVVDKEAWDEEIWVVDKEAVYEDKWVVDKEAWDEQVWVVDKEAVYEDKWIVDKEAWDEQVWVVDKEAVYEDKWVVDKEAVYEDKWIVDKEAWDEFIWVVDEEQKSEFITVIDKEAVYEDKWVIDKESGFNWVCDCGEIRDSI